jgi:peptide/nickel transport system ATP-binding protein
MTPLLEVSDLVKHFPIAGSVFRRSREAVRAVDGLSFHVDKGETLSIVGESGCGKSTVGKAILRLIEPTSGELRFDGKSYVDARGAEMKSIRRRLQVVFQDPYGSMNPRMRVRETIAEPLYNFGLAGSAAETTEKVGDLLARVGLPPDAWTRYPHELSGGQRQRLCIARALAPGADLIVCDEAVSALDVSVKAQIVNLLSDLQQQIGVAFLFISHDLAIVEHLTHRVAVMYLGKMVEVAERRGLFQNPRHPYTRALLSAVPEPRLKGRRERVVLKGDVPNPAHPPSGCRFHTRCPLAFERCRVEEPLLRSVDGEHLSACHLD